jgi:hypothetical protein
MASVIEKEKKSAELETPLMQDIQDKSASTN